jgi:hypothetical protein
VKTNLNSIPILICATFIAAIALAGTFGLLLLGRPVPEWIPVFDAAIATAYFGAGPFSVAISHLQALGAQAGNTSVAAIDTANHAIASLNTAVQGLQASAPAATPIARPTTLTS